ncbi:MAG: hypothetical protein ACC645_07410 [Pirellulales bacterium]
MRLQWILLAIIGFPPVAALAGDLPLLSFKPAGDRLFDFDTGAVKGRLRGNGKNQGISSFVDVETGRELTRSVGIFSLYRVFSTDRRWGHAARDWPMTAKLRADGAVEIDWPAREDHPLEITAVYRWKSPTTLDLEIVVRPQRSMPRFELFLSSYFDLQFKAFVYAEPMRSLDAKPGFIAADVNPLVRGSYLAFPIDRQAARMFFDRRWAPENGFVPWSVTRMLGAPIAMKRDAESDITLLLMSRPKDCFAVDLSYNMDPPDGVAGHGSVYLSLFGRDIDAGQSERAHVRLVVERDLSDERAVERYEQYVKEQRGE